MYNKIYHTPKKIYLVELRKRINQHANESFLFIGAFNNLDIASKWVKKNGRNAIRNSGINNGFYAICSCTENKSDGCGIELALDLDGNNTYLFHKDELKKG